VKNYNGDMEARADIAAANCGLRETRVGKATSREAQRPRRGDVLLVNLTGKNRHAVALHGISGSASTTHSSDRPAKQKTPAPKKNETLDLSWDAPFSSPHFSPRRCSACLGATQTGSKCGHRHDREALLRKHCTKCHGEKKQKGDLRVDTLKIDFESPKIMGHWEEIMNRINSGDMPPDTWRSAQARRCRHCRNGFMASFARRKWPCSFGRERVSFRKLTRKEYANTIRDLLGVNFDVRGPKRPCPKIRTGRASSASAP